MHILMAAPQPFFRPRGTPFSVLHRIRALLRLGHTVELVTYPFGESPELDGLTIHRSARPAFIRDVGIGPSLAKLALDASFFRLTARLAATGRFDLLHTHEEAGWIGGHVRRRHGLSHLYDMHSSLPQQLSTFGRFDWPGVARVFGRLERHTLDHADAVIAVCAALADHVRTTGYTGPVALIENTLDFDHPAPTPDAVAALRARLDLGDGPVIVYTGTLEPYQGLDHVLAAAPGVLARVPAARFVIVGGTAAQIEGLERAAAAAGVAHAMRFIAAVPPAEVGLYHHLAAALVTARSRGDNTPLKIYQYLRSGRPIVATRIASHTQVLDDASAELVAVDGASIAAGLVRVLTDAGRARSIVEGAGRLAAERYSEAAYMRALRGVLDALPARPRRQATRA